MDNTKDDGVLRSDDVIEDRAGDRSRSDFKSTKSADLGDVTLGK